MAPAFRPKSSMQAPTAAENSRKCTLHPTLGTRSKKANSLGLPSCRRRPRAYLPNLSAGRKDPAARSAQRGPDMSEDDLGGKPWGLR